MAQIDKSILTVKSLRDEINRLKDSLVQTKEGTQQWTETAKKLADAQTKLNNINKAAKGIEVENEKAQKNSIAALQKKISLLSNERKQMDMNSKEYKKATKELKNLRNELNEAEKNAGNFKLNVGNYASSITDAFQQMGGAVGGLTSPIAGVNKGLLSLAANPIGAVIAALVATIGLLTKGIKSSEENTNRFKKVLVPIQSLLTTVETAIQKLASGFLDFIEKTDLVNKAINVVEKGFQGLVTTAKWVTAKLKGESTTWKEIYEEVGESIDEFNQKQAETTNQTKKLTIAEQNLIKNRRAYALANSKDAGTLAEINNRIRLAEVTKDYAQMEELLAQKQEVRLRIAKRAVAEAAAEYNLIKGQNSFNDSNTEALDKENDALVALTNAKNALAEVEREIEIEKGQFMEKMFKSNIEILNNEKEFINQRLAIVQKGSLEEYRLSMELIDKDKELDILQAKRKITDKEQLAKTLETIEAKYNLKILKAEEDLYKTTTSLEEQALANQRDSWENGNLEWLKADVVYKEALLKNLRQMLNESDAEFEARVIKARKDLDAARQSLAGYSSGIGNVYGDGLAGNKVRTAEAGGNLDSIRRKEGEAEYDYQKRILEAQQELFNAETEMVNAKIDLYQELGESVLGVFNNIGDAYKSNTEYLLENGKITADEAKRREKIYKAMQIAQTTLSVANIVGDTSQGIMGVWKAYAMEKQANALTALSTGPAAAITAEGLNAKSLTQAIIQTATLAANGTASAMAAINGTVSSLRSLSSSNMSAAGGGTSSVMAPVINETNPYSYQRTLTTAEEEEILNKPIKVYVLEKEIKDAVTKATVRETESTW